MCAGDFATGGNYCLGFGGATVDKRLSQEILKAISPRGLDASVTTIEQLSHQGSDQRAALKRQIQQVQYESQRAFDQYNQVDPANRLVAEVLENPGMTNSQHLQDYRGNSKPTATRLHRSVPRTG